MNVLRCALIAVSLAVTAAGQMKDDLVGTWKLVSYWSTRPNGERVQPYGPHPTGFLTYTPQGRMSAILGDPARPRLSTEDRLATSVAERAEVFIGGLELANAYSELADAKEQRIRFEEEAERIRAAAGHATLPERFLEAIAHMPECGGIALGMDRLAMLFCGTELIRDVMAFPDDEA